MTEDDYCSYELSKFLNEKDCFDGEANCFIDVSGTRYDYTLLGFIQDEVLPCPTHAVIMKQLREQYGVCIVITPNFDTNGNIIYIPSIFKNGFYNGRPKNAHSESYPAAVEFAIMWVLTEML